MVRFELWSHGWKVVLNFLEDSRYIFRLMKKFQRAQSSFVFIDEVLLFDKIFHVVTQIVFTVVEIY